jgi:coenzyme PQQ precursor peptide PqqA
VYILDDWRVAGSRRDIMTWKTPKIVEIVCGAEINAYVSAEIA